MQRYTFYLFLETALHVSGGISTHHQEYIQLYLQYLALVRPLPLPAAIVDELERSSNSSTTAVTVSQVPYAVDTFVCVPDDGWRWHPKHVEQFPEINKLRNVVSCWIYIRVCLRWNTRWRIVCYSYHSYISCISQRMHAIKYNKTQFMKSIKLPYVSVT